MGEALGSAKGFDPASEADFAAALEGEVLYFGYEGELPLALLSGWMGSSLDSLEKTDLLLLTEKGKLFVHDADGYRCASAHANPAAWREAMRELSAGACSFAAQREDGLADNVRPDTLLFESESATAEQMSVRYPGYLDGQGGSDLTALLEAFAYDPYVRTYDEDKGSTLVFVENFSTLHVSADGSVIFNTSALEGGLEAYIAGEVEQDEVLRLQTDFAYTLLREVQGSMSDSSQAMLFDVEERDDNVCVLSFIQLVGGIPVEAGTPFAWFEFQGNKMIEAQFHLRTLEPTGVPDAGAAGHPGRSCRTARRPAHIAGLPGGRQGNVCRAAMLSEINRKEACGCQQWSRVKTILIIILLFVDSFLLCTLGGKVWFAYQRGQEVRAHVQTVLQKNGMTLADSMKIPGTAMMPQLSIDRSRAGEAAVALRCSAVRPNEGMKERPPALKATGRSRLERTGRAGRPPDPARVCKASGGAAAQRGRTGAARRRSLQFRVGVGCKGKRGYGEF